MKNKLSVIFILLAGALWGSSCIFVNKLSSMGFSPMQCTAIRTLFGALILNAALLIKGRHHYKMSLASYGLCAASGICSVLSMCIFYYYSMTYTSAAVSAILLYTAPLFVMIMSVLFLGERFTAKKIVAFVIAIIGCALVSGIVTGAAASGLGILFGVLSGFSYSLYGIFADLFMKKNKEPLTFSALSFAFAALGALIISKPWQIVGVCAEAEKPYFLPLLFVVFSLCTAVLPYLFYTKGLTGVRPDVASILAFSEPLMAAVFGIAVLGQPLDAWQVVGILLVTLAIVVLNVNFRRRGGEEIQKL
ncbi:MAG: hypothetical protein E7653_06560 [Ruminococcaceae bacterium]|nr:hypothetical protein [Oscillospiraceae bacterium]